jgi:hypothetical protein
MRFDVHDARARLSCAFQDVLSTQDGDVLSRLADFVMTSAPAAPQTQASLENPEPKLPFFEIPTALFLLGTISFALVLLLANIVSRPGANVPDHDGVFRRMVNVLRVRGFLLRLLLFLLSS